MTPKCAFVTGGVDTHKKSHHAVALNERGVVVGSREFAANQSGYTQMHVWYQSFGCVNRIGVEGCGTYGANLATHLKAQGEDVVEVTSVNKQLRRSAGKSDESDAEIVARHTQTGLFTVVPKDKGGKVEKVRVLRLVRRSATEAKVSAVNLLHALIVTSPEEVKDVLREKTTLQIVKTCAEGDLNVLTNLAKRILVLDVEIKTLDKELAKITRSLAPKTLSLLGVGPDCAGQLLTTLGQNADRIYSEAAFAKLCGVAPIQASSGKTKRYRLNRGGDRQANRALHMICVVRMRYCEKTRAYIERRTAEGLSKKEIMRCLKRYIAREIFATLKEDLGRCFCA